MARKKGKPPTACHACGSRHPGLILPHCEIPVFAGMTQRQMSPKDVKNVRTLLMKGGRLLKGFHLGLVYSILIGLDDLFQFHPLELNKGFVF